MSTALQCPACGWKHRISTLPDTATFPCGRCGRMLKVPESAPGSAPAPAPTRSPAEAPRAAPAAAPPVAPSPAPSATVEAPPAEPPATRRRARSKRRAAVRPVDHDRAMRVAWPARLVVWLLAIPVGLVLVALPARRLRYLTGQRMLDVVIKPDLDRFVPLVVIVGLWALVTATVVHLVLELLRARKVRRRRSAAPPSVLVSSAPGLAPPPPPRRRGGGSATVDENGRAAQRRPRAGARGGS